MNKFNILEEPLVSYGEGLVSLPELFASLSRGTVGSFRALRPHQRPAWHMFLVQLAALALWHGNRGDLPEDASQWRALLRCLTPDHPGDEPWCLVVEDRAKPAFLQPPDPGGLKWAEVPTPDALDMLITARNHDLKTQLAHEARPEDWLFALVSLQTMEGYGGKFNYGIARMNGGSSSRVLLALAPGHGNGPDPACWWQRDVTALLALRARGEEGGPCRAGGIGLIWCHPWTEGVALEVFDLDPWAIEACRRIRLSGTGNSVHALRAGSVKSRIEAAAFKGAIGDPWAPVHRVDGKSLTLGERHFSYKLLVDLYILGDWEVPPLAQPQPGETGDRLLVVEAIARGNSTTDGFQSRIVPVPFEVSGMLGTPLAQDLSRQMLADVAACDKALRNALTLAAARGEAEKRKPAHARFAASARLRFDRAADAMFFPALWTQIEANAESSGEPLKVAKASFRSDLVAAAEVAFTTGLAEIPCAAIHRPRAEARAHRAFRRALLHAGLIEVKQEANHDQHA